MRLSCGCPGASEARPGGCREDKTCWSLSSASETWSCVEEKKKSQLKKENQNGPNHILELPYIRKSFPDIFTTNSDPLSLEHRDYNWQSVTYPFTPASNGR